VKTELKGIVPAITSPCDEQDRFLPDQFADLATWLYQQGVHGLYACGGTGEGYLMHLDERKLAAEITGEISRQFNGTAIIHVGTLQTRDALELAAHAAEVGVDAISSLPPPGCGHSQLVSYYTDVARTAQLPLLIYYHPGYTGHHASQQQLLELLDIEGVVGLKMTTFNLYLMKELLLARPDIVVFSGSDEFVCPGLLFGADGAIGMVYNIVPRIFVAIWDAFQSGDVLRAMALQEEEIRLCSVMDEYGGFEIIELWLAKRGFGPYCRRRPRRLMDSDTLKIAEPRITERLEAIEEMLSEQ